MDGLRLPSYRKEFQKDDGLSRSLDSGSDPQWIEVCHPTGGGVVTWARTAAQTSNYGRTTLGAGRESDSGSSVFRIERDDANHIVILIRDQGTIVGGAERDVTNFSPSARVVSHHHPGALAGHSLHHGCCRENLHEGDVGGLPTGSGR